MSLTVEEVKSAIEQAFANETMPTDNVYYATDIRPDDRDGIYLNKAFLGKHWREVPKRALAMEAALPFAMMTTEASRFYFPAYLLASLEPEDDETGGRILLRTRFAINPTADGLPHLYEDSMINVLTKEQIDAVGLFLKYCRYNLPDDWDRRDAKRALFRYSEFSKFTE